MTATAALSAAFAVIGAAIALAWFVVLPLVSQALAAICREIP